MRKYSFILSAVAVTGLTVAAKAGESNYWFDIRDNAGAGQSITAQVAPFTIGHGDVTVGTDVGTLIAGANGRGNGQVVRICPTVSNNIHLGVAGPPAFPYWPNFDSADDASGGNPNGDASTANLWLYADVNGHNAADQGPPDATGDVISSIGIDMAIALGTAATRYEISSVNWSWTLVDPTVPVNYGFAPGTSSRAGVVGAKYVKVPVDGASAYATTNGLTGAANPYRLGRIRLAAATRGTFGCLPVTTAFGAGHTAASSYNVSMSVNNLLITRTFSTGGAATPVEMVSFGYASGLVDAEVSGNVSPSPAGVRDGVVQVRMKGDFTGDGRVTTADQAQFLVAQGAGAGITQLQRYAFDSNGNGLIQTSDFARYLNLQAAPCP